MADISALFDSVLFPVEIKNKLTGEPIGLTIWIAPFEADESANAWFRSRILVERFSDSSGAAIPMDRMAEIALQADVKRCAASIRKWDWQGNSFAELGVNPACTDTNKLRVLNGASFILDQLMEAAGKAENFTRTPVES